MERHKLGTAKEGEVPGLLPPGDVDTQSLRFTAFSRMEGSERAAAEVYILDWLKHSDEGSSFQRQIQKIGHLSGTEQIKVLTGQGYDMLLLKQDDNILGHAAFQRHDDSLHMFSMFVSPENRGKGLSKVIAEGFISYAQEAGLSEVRIGSGGDAVIERMLDGLRKREEELGVVVGEKGIISLNHPPQ